MRTEKKQSWDCKSDALPDRVTDLFLKNIGSFGGAMKTPVLDF